MLNMHNVLNTFDQKSASILMEDPVSMIIFLFLVALRLFLLWALSSAITCPGITS